MHILKEISLSPEPLFFFQANPVPASTVHCTYYRSASYPKSEWLCVFALLLRRPDDDGHLFVDTHINTAVFDRLVGVFVAPHLGEKPGFVHNITA